MASDVVEVISIGRITEISTGDFVYQVQFGKMFDISDQNRQLIQPMPGMPKKQVSIVLILNIGFKDIVPYHVGSKWDLSIGPRGDLSLKEVKE